MPITMHTRQHRSSGVTYVWDGSTLYVFHGSIAQAQIEGAGALRAHMVAQGSEGVVDLPCDGASVVWVEGTPYLFPGSLMDASKWGKNSKSARRQGQRERHRGVQDERAGFDKQYGLGIGEKER